MTGPELAAAITELGLTRAGFATLCGVDTATVYCWLREPGAKKWRPVPVYAETIVGLMRVVKVLGFDDGKMDRRQTEIRGIM